MNTLKHTKTILYIILAIGILIVIGYGINRYFETRKSSGLSLQEIMKLEEGQRKEILLKDANNLKSEAESLPESVDSGTKYSIYIRLAEFQIALEQYDDAINSLNSIPEDKRNNSRLPIAYAKAYYGKGDMALTEENINKALSIDDELPEAWIVKLNANQDLPTDQLKTMYLEAIAKTKSNIEIMKSYAKFSEKIGDKATAIAAWETAINHDPANEGKYREEINRLKL